MTLVNKIGYNSPLNLMYCRFLTLINYNFLKAITSYISYAHKLSNLSKWVSQDLYLHCRVRSFKMNVYLKFIQVLTENNNNMKPKKYFSAYQKEKVFFWNPACWNLVTESSSLVINILYFMSLYCAYVESDFAVCKASECPCWRFYV